METIQSSHLSLSYLHFICQGYRDFYRQEAITQLLFVLYKILTTKDMKRAIFILALAAVLLAVSPPIFNYSYHSIFVQTVTVGQAIHKIAGQVFYDPQNNRERVDRIGDQYDIFCSTVLPNVSTNCQHLTTKNKRWIVFPQRSECCFCCDSEHGCGILKPDWLAGSEYKGQEEIAGVAYDKWSKDGVVGYNYLYTTPDANQTPKRLNENGRLTDYTGFQKEVFADSVFALPAYCKESSPTNCPLESICGKHRSPQNILREQ